MTNPHGERDFHFAAAPAPAPTAVSQPNPPLIAIYGVKTKHQADAVEILRNVPPTGYRIGLGAICDSWKELGAKVPNAGVLAELTNLPNIFRNQKVLNVLSIQPISESNEMLWKELDQLTSFGGEHLSAFRFESLPSPEGLQKFKETGTNAKYILSLNQTQIRRLGDLAKTVANALVERYSMVDYISISLDRPVDLNHAYTIFHWLKILNCQAKLGICSSFRGPIIGPSWDSIEVFAKDFPGLSLEYRPELNILNIGEAAHVTVKFSELIRNLAARQKI